MHIRSIFTALILAAAIVPVCAAELAPFKDDLFAYPTTLSSDDGGDYRVIDYRELRDINERDEVPERKVKRAYVALGVRSEQQDLRLKSDAGEIRFYAVGKQQGAAIITVYLHGKGGSRKQGVDDFTFGGNFNRIKNLMAENDGLYLSPDFSDFEEAGTAQVVALIAHYAAASPGAKLFVACGSMGGYICWELAVDERIAPRLSGLLLLGSVFDEDYPKSPAFKRKVPVLFGHGSRDPVFPVEGQEEFYRSLRASKGGYPTRFVRFESGSHGTPIRMTDWRETLNWMLSVGP
jgi:dienelactone hydrolase